jgi:hypothetical protein
MPKSNWSEGAVPESCFHCGRSDVKHYGKGLCGACYNRPGVKDQYDNLANTRNGRKTATDDMVDDPTDSYNGGTSVPSLRDVDPLGGDGVGQDAPNALGEPSPYAPGERAPGSGLPSPSVPAAGPTKSGRWGRFFGGSKKGPPSNDGAPLPPRGRERTPKLPAGRRVSASETISDAWSGVGGFVARNPGHVPLGRYMQFQAPVAGEMLDEAVKGTIIDKVALQRIVKARGKFDLIGAVFGPPAIIYAIERDPSRQDVLIPMLRSSIRNALPLMVPAIKKIKVKAEATQAAAAELFADDPNYDPSIPPEDYILNLIFGGWEPPQAQPQPTDAVTTVEVFAP